MFVHCATNNFTCERGNEIRRRAARYSHSAFACTRVGGGTVRQSTEHPPMLSTPSADGSVSLKQWHLVREPIRYDFAVSEQRFEEPAAFGLEFRVARGELLLHVV